MRPKAPKYSRIKAPRWESKAHLVFVSEKPCCVCGGSPVQAHHPITGDARRKYGKSHDWECVPLCPKHHTELHDVIGSEDRFKEIHGVSFSDVAWQLCEESKYCTPHN